MRFNGIYPLVNVYITMERSTMQFMGKSMKIHYFDWAMFNSYFDITRGFFWSKWVQAFELTDELIFRAFSLHCPQRGLCTLWDKQAFDVKILLADSDADSLNKKLTDRSDTRQQKPLSAMLAPVGVCLVSRSCGQDGQVQLSCARKGSHHGKSHLCTEIPLWLSAFRFCICPKQTHQESGGKNKHVTLW